MGVKILDMGLGNISSVASWLSRSDIKYKLVGELCDVDTEDTLVLCGVGNTVEYVTKLIDLGFQDHIVRRDYESRNRWYSGRAKIVGICSGFQALCQKIDEDGRQCAGLGLIPGYCHSIGASKKFNNGWHPCSDISGIERILGNESYPGFRHSLYFNHGGGIFVEKDTDNFFYLSEERYTVGYMSKNIVGMQFHPEKSGSLGDFICRRIFNV